MSSKVCIYSLIGTALHYQPDPFLDVPTRTRTTFFSTFDWPAVGAVSLLYDEDFLMAAFHNLVVVRVPECHQGSLCDLCDDTFWNQLSKIGDSQTHLKIWESSDSFKCLKGKRALIDTADAWLNTSFPIQLVKVAPSCWSRRCESWTVFPCCRLVGHWPIRARD